MWPGDAESLLAVQRELAASSPEPWVVPDRPLLVGGCWVCFPEGLTGPGDAGDPAWAAGVVMREGAVVAHRVRTGVTGTAYEPGLLALRMGHLLEDVVRALDAAPDVLLLDATGRDHPRRAGLALHLGAVLDLPTVGITHRPLLAEGDWPADIEGATAPLRVGEEHVASWLRTRAGVRPLVVHPGWRVDVATAVDVVKRVVRGRRTPEPLRQARHLARLARQEEKPG